MNRRGFIGGGVALVVMSAANGLLAAEWEDPSVNSINRLPPRTYAMPLADEAAALTDALEPETPYKMSLNGTWKLSWAGNPDLRTRRRSWLSLQMLQRARPSGRTALSNRQTAR